MNACSGRFSVCKQRASERRGVVLAVALVFFLLCSAILCTLLQTVVNHKHQVRDHRQIDQARCLADAAIDRAVAQLHKQTLTAAKPGRFLLTKLAVPLTAKSVFALRSMNNSPDRGGLWQADYPSGSCIESGSHAKRRFI